MKKIIDKNRPLPYNTIYKYEECFAKLLLEQLFPDIFKDLKLLDKPDLQNLELNFGIEVTTAIESKNLELDNLYTRLEYDLVQNRENVIKKIEALGGKIINGILFHPKQNRDLSNIEKSICNKLDKLNGNDYKIFSKNYLFITTYDFLLKQECIGLFSKYKVLQCNYKYKYQKIYIYCLGGELFEFDFVNNKYNIYEVENVYEKSIEARKMVEIKECE